MTNPPSSQARAGRHVAHRSRLPGVVRIIMSDTLAADAVVDLTAGVVTVSSHLTAPERRRAVRAALSPVTRFPAVAAVPSLAGFRARRAVTGAAEWVLGLGQHAMTFASDQPIVAAAAALAVLGGATTAGVITGAVPVAPFTAGTAAGRAAASSPPPVYARLPHYPASYLGVYEAGAPASYAPVEQFGDLIRHRPNLAVYYAGWGEAFASAFARAAAAHGATPVVQLNPYGISLQAIASGQADPYLAEFASEVHAYRRNVVISFGHEMNGKWYPWGYRHVSPRVFVAAWQYIVTFFRAAGDYNVTWLWTVNVASPATGPVRDWWPGAKYVTWAGVDGYFYSPRATFSSVFGPTLRAVRRLTSDPVLIAETAASPPQQPEAAQIAGLFRGIRRRQILGFIWYDHTGHRGNRWRLEGNTAAADAFREAARGWGRR